MELEIITLSEVNQTEEDRYHLILLICGIERYCANELIYKTEVEIPM